MKIFILMLILFMGQTACRASFTTLDDDSGISGANPDSADASDGNGNDLPIGGEDTNQGPPGSGDGVEIRIVVVFGPGADEQCPDGGQKTTIGKDKNGDGQIDEIISIEYECNDGTMKECQPDPNNGGGGNGDGNGGGGNGGDGNGGGGNGGGGNGGGGNGGGGKDDPGQSEDYPSQSGTYLWCQEV